VHQRKPKRGLPQARSGKHLWMKDDDAGRESHHVNAVLLKRTHCGIGVNGECAEALSREQEPTPVDPSFGAIAQVNVVAGAIERQRMHIAGRALEDKDAERRRHGSWECLA
jgi:hypothetical protein